MRGEDDVRVVEQGVVLGVVHVQSHPGDPSRDQRLERRVVVDQGSTAAVDEDSPWPRHCQRLGVDEVVGPGDPV
jgi:hypothetical protein